MSLIEATANRLTGGNKTEAVAMALRYLQQRDARSGSLFAAHPGSVRVRGDVDLIASVLDADDRPDAETGAEIAR